MITLEIHELKGFFIAGASLVRMWVGNKKIERQFSRSLIDDALPGDECPQVRLSRFFNDIFERDGAEGICSSILWRFGILMPD